MSFTRLIRFLDKDGVERYGNVEDEVPASEVPGKMVQLVSGNIEIGFKVLEAKAEVEKFKPPKKPVIFATPPDRLAGPLDDIKVHPDAQELLDYEGELSIVIGKDGYDISEDEALDYVLGYAVSNDLSARNLHAIDVSGYQMGYAKSFDQFGPTGPYLVSPKLVPDPQDLELETTVNGKVRQSTNTSQMLWTCRQLISFASRGRTLRRGTVIMTGTPEGVGWHTNGCLKDGDVVQVEIKGIGYIKNKMANRIAKIGKGIVAPVGAERVNCSGKIISPGFVDTHHHLWQTQLKGSHAEQSVFDYLVTGFWQSYAYKPQDMYWGQLGGALEAIDSGTTFVLDHAHGNQTNEHATQALSATIASGIRSIFAYSHAPYFTKWDSRTCELSRDIMPESSMAHIFELAKGQPYGNGRVHIGFGFDYWFLPKEAVVGIFSGLRNAGIKLFTSHYAKNPALGYNPLIHTLQSYDLIKSPNDILLSHATGLDAQEKARLAETRLPISSTPDTEAQMGFGWPAAFTPGVNTTLGVDCHTSSTSSILSLARSASHMARHHDAVAEIDGADGPPRRMHLQPRGSTLEAFNAATINGARAVLLGDQTGSLKEGKLADLVIFDAAGSLAMSCVSESDPLAAVVRHSGGRDVEGVIIDGIWRKKHGKICPVHVEETGKMLEWPAIRDKLLESQNAIRQRQKDLNLDKAREALIAMFRIERSNLIEKPKA